LSANKPQTFRGEYSWATKIHGAEYKQGSGSLYDVIETYENLYVEEQYQLKILVKNMNIFLKDYYENST
jgi:hypothetical protein